jgi:hypothetical protein
VLSSIIIGSVALILRRWRRHTTRTATIQADHKRARSAVEMEDYCRELWPLFERHCGACIIQVAPPLCH